MRIAWALLIMVILAVGLSAIPYVTAGHASTASKSGSAGLEIAELREQLAFGLKARQARDYVFIDRIVAMVRARQLPLEMVESTFLWARRKQPYPFPYFVRALQMRAAEAGIEI